MTKSDTKDRVRAEPAPAPPKVAGGEAAGKPSGGEYGYADEPDVEADATAKIGMVVDGRYRILSLIGRGGMGSVYRAEHVTIRRQVALKLMHPSLAGIPEIGKRFEREAYAIGRIDHPNCVNVSDFGQLADGTLFLVMEYLEGQSLGDLLAAERRLDPVRALRITRHVVRGLGHAHGVGIVHRDVKPENVLLTRTEDHADFAKILDFGIAKLLGRAATESGENDAKLTQAGLAFGTPIYMSPEQAVGGQVDGRADLYAATVLLYEMIAGTPPFASDDKIEVMSMHTMAPVPPLSDTAADVALPPGLDELLARGLAKRPDERFQDANEYVAAIDRVLERAGASQTTPAPMAQPADEHPHARSVRSGRGTVPVVYNTAPPELGGPPPVFEGLETRPRRGRGPLLFGGIGLAVVITLAAVIGTTGGSPAHTEDAAPASVEERPLAERAERMLARGNPQEAIDLLEGRRDRIASDARALLQLGHAYSAKRMHAEALETYRRALQLEPAVVEDPALDTNLKVMIDEKTPDIVLDASDLLLVTHLSNDAVVEKLVKWATEHADAGIRHRALKLTDTHNIGDKVDRVKSYSLDLAHGETCEERREAVAKLRALGDKRAIEPLTKASFIKRGRGRSSVNINACLREDAEEAIKYLQSMQLVDAGPPAGADR